MGLSDGPLVSDGRHIRERILYLLLPCAGSVNIMKLLTKTCLVLVAVVGLAPLFGQSAIPPVLSLDDAIAIAATDNPQVEMAQAKQGEARAGARSSRSALLPKIGVSETFIDSTDPVFAFGARLRQGRFTAGDLSLGTLNYPPPTSDFTSAAGATWMVFDSGRTLNLLRSAHTNAEAAAQQTVAARQDVAFAVVRAYYRALLADQEKITTAAAVERARSFAKQAHDRVDTGMALAADGMQADVEVSQRAQDAAEAESNALVAYADLAGVLGDTSKTLVLAVTEGNPGDIAASIDELQSLALRRRPDLIAARTQIVAAAQSLRSSRDAFGPQVSTFANLESDNPHLTGGGNNNWTVGAKVELQLFDGGERRAQVSKAAAQQQMAEASYRQAVIQAGLGVKRAYYARQTAERQFGISGEILRKTQETLRTSLDRYTTGLVVIDDVLREQEQLRSVELNRVESLYQWWIADAQLRLATGDMNIKGSGVHP